MVTPTSPNTASHIPAIPRAPRIRNTLLIPRAITIFCMTICFVAFATSIASTSLDGSSVIRTTSAASMAASEPSPPIAIPTSARARTGASLIPSPTKANLLPGLFLLSKSSTFSTFLVRKQLCIIFIQLQFFCNRLPNFFIITGKHDCFFHADMFQVRNCFFTVRLHFICYQNTSCILTIYCQINFCTCVFTGCVLYTFCIHKFRIASKNFLFPAITLIPYPEISL